ncbi:MAG: hypothetical protein J6W64_10100 [Bacilli bacterium]|nr:hypothetical protein [Bacilli bacterium]
MANYDSYYVEYQMSRKCANEYLKDRKGPDRNMKPQDYLVKIVNEEYGLLKTCTKVIII